MISFDEFKKVDIRIGTITAVEVVPDADKLLKLTVDVGEEKPRTIVSGIREYVGDPQKLVGKQTPFVLNLEYRTIRGIESQGMLFAVGGPPESRLATGGPLRSREGEAMNAGFEFLKPEHGVLPGSPLV